MSDKKVFNNILEAIGNTPMVRINSIAKDVKGTVYAKIETTNPGNSIKDRMAVKMIEDAEKSGALKPGRDDHRGHLGQHRDGARHRRGRQGLQVRLHHHRQAVEGEGGRAQGLRRGRHRLPDQRRSRGPALLLLRVVTPREGSAELVEGEPVRQPVELRRALRADRAGNLGTDGRPTITHLVVGVGTGGTISGVGRFLKEKNPQIKVWGIDTYGSVLKKYKETGILDKNEIYPYITEGIGEDFLPKNVDFSVIDHFEKVTDKDAALMTRRIAREEGIFAGNSAGSAMAGLLQLKDHFREGDVIVVIFHDHGSRYLGKMFNDDWMREKGFFEKSGMTARDLVASGMSGELLSIEGSQPVEAAVAPDGRARLLPDLDHSRRPSRRIAERDPPLRRAGDEPGDQDASRSSQIMQPAFPFVDISTPVDLLATMITPQTPAVLVRDFKTDKTFIITRSDIIRVIV